MNLPYLQTPFNALSNREDPAQIRQNVSRHKILAKITKITVDAKGLISVYSVCSLNYKHNHIKLLTWIIANCSGSY